jgi:hypothetical protein
MGLGAAHDDLVATLAGAAIDIRRDHARRGGDEREDEEVLEHVRRC